MPAGRRSPRHRAISTRSAPAAAPNRDQLAFSLLFLVIRRESSRTRLRFRRTSASHRSSIGGHEIQPFTFRRVHAVMAPSPGLLIESAASLVDSCVVRITGIVQLVVRQLAGGNTQTIGDGIHAQQGMPASMRLRTPARPSW